MIHFSSIHIKTDRLILRPIALRDLDATYRIYSDNETMKFWSEPPLQNPAQAKQKIIRNRLANQKDEVLTLALESKESQIMIGQISLFNSHKNSARAEIGYVLSRSHWHKGLMSEALMAFIHFCFTDLNLRRLEADIDPANTASSMLLKSLGFSKEGLLKQRWMVGKLITDSELYGLVNKTWSREPQE